MHKPFILSHKLDAIDKMLVVIFNEATVVSKVQFSGSDTCPDFHIEYGFTKEFEKNFGCEVNQFALVALVQKIIWLVFHIIEAKQDQGDVVGLVDAQVFTQVLEPMG